MKNSEFNIITDEDLYLFNEGSHFHLYDKLGSRQITHEGEKGRYFSVWAPNAQRVAVIGDFNGWDNTQHPLSARGSSGIWEGFFPAIPQGTIYKYYIASLHGGYEVEKADPYGVHHETSPKTGSITWDLDYKWDDTLWMKNRKSANALDSPMSIYELHLGSWMRIPEDDNRSLNYREAAVKVAQYVKKMNFTHVELLPIMEHPFYGSWGYQSTGYFAPSSRYGTPQDFMYFVDHLHQEGIGVILDWVPSHFAVDMHGLSYFDGTHLYEHADERKGFHPDWGSSIFNYGRHEVQSFLISSAFYWLDKYHIDGIRVDAVASMLYLDYSREDGEWIPNEYGGKENLEAISFLKRFNQEVYSHFPSTITMAEESTDWPMVSRPLYTGGLGFGFKWDMGWMHDTLSFMKKDAIYRKYHQSQITFRMLYAFNENFCLPLSHDEVVHGKGSLLGTMSGTDWEKAANLKMLFGYMYGQPGKKLMFMGCEFGQWGEWSHEKSLDWHVTGFAPHCHIQRWVEDLNKLYRNEPALYEVDFSAEGFYWMDCNDSQNSILSFVRKDAQGCSILVICNFTPIPRYNYRVGVPEGGKWTELLNSDAEIYGGTGHGNWGGFDADEHPSHAQSHSLNLTLPPLGIMFFKKVSEKTKLAVLKN